MFPKILQKVLLPIISTESCVRAIKDKGILSYPETMPSTICTLDPEGGKATCNGDSGGPLVVDGKLAGITSWGFECGSKDGPKVFTNVAYYTKWIEKNIATNEN